ncbi:MAG TPA: PaaI family thioesterase [Hyphomonadaceae bacterium]|nr:PaaI family thioesterase [Hyphomonadaceae bacterium]
MSDPSPENSKDLFRGKRVGVTLADPAAKGKSGIEILRAMISGELPGPPIARALNFWIAEVGPGTAAFEGEPGDESLNPMGGVHGGWALTIIDSATGCAGMSTLEAGVGWATVETKANMVRAIKPNSGRYRCEAKVLAAGRTIITTDSQVIGPDGKLYAHGTSTLIVLRS